MGILRGNEAKKQLVKDKTKALFGELLDCDEDYAIALIDWYLEKTKINKKHIAETNLRNQLSALRGLTDSETSEKIKEIKKEIRKTLPTNYPNDLKKGDIVYVNFGQGFAGEISEGHYGVIVSRKGSNFFIAPLTKSPQPDGTNTMTITGLGLPGGVNTGYVNFGQVRFVHYRRLENIIGLTERKSIAEKIEELLEKFNNILNKE
ncbi:type II toxin-antitoxin system PemK/MazF family toxin [Peribacillus tepidiphilus]|uniref:type II toxin-antitoxin system PemK/MazF family toxin n=1 Tax=Peribacillus tepidiphilus TaxID=2652445 RepID=UPI001292B4E4|nr:type II toxin-antitoxin system PemK/MazF family toxin [Peribacillus tepidiphilus]